MAGDPAMLKYFQDEWKAGNFTEPQKGLMQLLQNPDHFLRHHPLTNTFDCKSHGQTRAYFRNGAADAKRPGSKLGTANFHTTESFNIEMISGANAFGVEFPVHGVFTGESSKDPVWYKLDGSGPAMMLTAKLTGCTFVVKAGVSASVEVTHLMPHQETGLELNERMKGGGKVAWGRLKYDFEKRTVNVIGVRHANRWNIWAQKLEKANTPKILSVHKIWPID